MPDPDIFGWDIGGAHVKACRLRRGELVDAVQWACPLWQGLDRLERVLGQARERWPQLAAARHAVTMTGEMADLFEHREDGVRRIAALLNERLPGPPDGRHARPDLHFFAGDAGWRNTESVAGRWAEIASANWLATARHAALALQADGGHGVLIDIGSTTTDLIAFGRGQVLTTGRSDSQRLATGELVYHGVVRTPLCAVAPRIGWRGALLNVMNEFFATSADVYRLTGELDPVHDLHPAADNAPKDVPATRRRLARMIGLDERDAAPSEWLAFAREWRACQVAEIVGALRRVAALHRLGADITVVSAGCGDFLVPDVIARAFGADGASRRGVGFGPESEPDPDSATGIRCVSYGAAIAPLASSMPADTAALARWAQVCAPCIAVAALLAGEPR